MKARYNYRIYPKSSQLVPLAKAMGCARVVWNDALWLYKQAYKNDADRPKNISSFIKDCAGRYFASFVVEVEPEQAPKTDNSCGIDLGLNHFAILSTGEKIKNPRLHKKLLRKIRKANRRLAKAKRDSKRRERRKHKLAKLHAKVKDQRTDFLHCLGARSLASVADAGSHRKLTTKLVSENQALAVEDLNVAGLVKNRKLSRAISDAGWAKFKTMLAAKCDKYGRELVIVDRWYPSSQICSCCGQSGGRKELKVREWECLYCGAVHDRDINAAENLNRWAGGQSDQYKNGRGASFSLPMVAICDEASTTYEQLRLF